MARHRHLVNVRADGIAVVLGPLLSDSRIAAAVLVDVDSGMVLDAWSAAGAAPGAPDLELLGAQHAEVVRGALELMRAWPHPEGSGTDACEVVLGTDDGRRHLLRTVPDPHGDRLALAVVIDGPPRVVERVRKRLRSVSVDALTAGPTMTRRPVLGGWSFAMPRPDVPAGPAPALVPRPAPQAPPPPRTSLSRASLLRASPSPTTPSRPSWPDTPAPPAPPVAAPPVAARFDRPAPPAEAPVRDRAGVRSRSEVDGPSDEPPAGEGLPGGRVPDVPRSSTAVVPRRPSPPAALPAPPASRAPSS